MKKALCTIIVVGLVAATLEPASGDYLTGTMLKDRIEASDRVIDGRGYGNDVNLGAQAGGYLMGVVDALQDVFVCVPQGTTVRQIMAIVDRYLRDHPERWGESAGLLAMTALVAVFPCKATQ